MNVGIVYNPTAGSATRLNRLARLERQLVRLGHEVIIYRTRFSGDASTLARRAVDDGADVVLAVGGDGTVNEVIQVLAGLDVPLAVYPAGTTNVWCQQIHMPVNPRRAAQIISEGPRYNIDLGKAGDRYFLLMIGIGLDGEIVEAVDLKLKKKVGKLAYILAGVRALKYRGTFATIVLNSDTPHERTLNLQANLIIMTNSERYATVKLAPEALVDDGKLDMYIFPVSNFSGKLSQMLSILLNWRKLTRHIVRLRVDHVCISTNPPVASQVDGDFLGKVGHHALEIKCVPEALQVIVPDKAPTSIFSRSRLFKLPHLRKTS